MEVRMWVLYAVKEMLNCHDFSEKGPARVMVRNNTGVDLYNLHLTQVNDVGGVGLKVIDSLEADCDTKWLDLGLRRGELQLSFTLDSGSANRIKLKTVEYGPEDMIFEIEFVY